MTMPSSKTPLLGEYFEAVQNPQHCFPSPDLKTASFDTNSLGLPNGIPGNFAVVFPLTLKSGKIALRCFTVYRDDQEKRYKALSDTLKKIQEPYLVDFEFVADGILVNKEKHPILRMEWVDGEPLDEYVRRHLRSPPLLRTLADRFRAVMADLNRLSIAHGDLQHGNILVSGHGIRLIDYDGMFVGPLQGLESHEVGHRNYQHPGRTSKDFDSNIDNFSAWLIYTSLVAISVDPGLFDPLIVTGAGDERLLFGSEDLENPAGSPVFQRLKSMPNAEVHSLVDRLQYYLVGKCCDVPPLEVFKKAGGSALPDWIKNKTPHLPQESYGVLRRIRSLVDRLREFLAGRLRSAPRLPRFVRENHRTLGPMVACLLLAFPVMSLSPVRNSTDDEDMALIPAGKFLMGSEDGREWEKPVHAVYVDAFFIDKHEVTNRRYRKFVETGHKRPAGWDNPRLNKDDQPVVGVGWNDAVEFCRWAGKRLPTEAEWEKAARGGLEGKEYPWGHEDPNGKACCGLEYGSGEPKTVGSYPPNGYGLFDMAGNVWEFCSDWFDTKYYEGRPKLDVNPTGPKRGSSHVLRGGSWYDSADKMRCSLRNDGPSFSDFTIGFRCVRACKTIDQTGRTPIQLVMICVWLMAVILAGSLLLRVVVPWWSARPGG